MGDPQSKYVTVNGVKLRYLDWGTEGLPYMVCLHGHTGQARIWDQLAEEARNHYHVLAFDQRGHGESGRADDGYARDRFVEDLAALMDALDLPKVTLAGLSMGGWHSMLYTPGHQDRVEKIVMVDIGPESSREAMASRGNRPPTPEEFDSLDGAIEWARTGNTLVSDEDLRSDVAHRTRQREDGKWTWKADPRLFQPLTDMTDETLIKRYWDGLSAISCPILHVRGRESGLVSDDILERMSQANPNFQNVDVPDAGHVVTVDNPQGFNDAVRDFLGL